MTIDAFTGRHRAVFGLVVLATLVLTACGSSPSSQGSGTTSASDLTYAAAQVAASSSVPSFTAPGPAVDASKARGKRVFVIPLVPNPFNQAIEKTMKYLADQAGIKYTIYPNQGLVSQWVQAFNQAISQKPDLIILSTAPDPRELAPQLQQAKAAGIPVLVTHFYDQTSPPPPDCLACAPGVTALETAPFYVAGKAEADWIINDSKGKGHVLIVSSKDILPSPPTVSVIEKEFTDHCGGCSFSEVSVPVSDWNTKVGSTVAAQLQAHPDIAYVDCLYDAMVQTAVPSVQLAGGAGKVKVVSYNGSTFALKFIQDGNIMGMDVGEPTIWIGYAVMDQSFRILAGMPPVNDETTPIRVFDKTNVNDAGVPPAQAQGYGNAYVNGFNQLWGVNWSGFNG